MVIKMNKNCNCLKKRTNIEKNKLIKRINVIEGQLNGVKKMIENDRAFDDILIQLLAIDKATKSLGNEMLKMHLSTCVVEDIKNDKLEVIDEIIELSRRLS